MIAFQSLASRNDAVDLTNAQWNHFLLKQALYSSCV